MEAGISITVVIFIIGFIVLYNHRKETEQTNVYQELQNKYYTLDSRYDSLKREYEELNKKYETAKQYGELDLESTCLLYFLDDVDETYLYQNRDNDKIRFDKFLSDENLTDEQLAEEALFPIVSLEILNVFADEHDKGKKEVSKLYKNLEKLCYVRKGLIIDKEFTEQQNSYSNSTGKIYYKGVCTKLTGKAKSYLEFLNQVQLSALRQHQATDIFFRITDSRPSLSKKTSPRTDEVANPKLNKEALIEKRLRLIIKSNFDAGVFQYKVFNELLSKESILIILEVYFYLCYLTLFFLQRNNVDEKIIDLMNGYSWGFLEYSKMWDSLNLTKEELDKFIINRTENYTNILEDYIELTENYYSRIAQYQMQLFSEIIKNDKLSYYTPQPKNASDHTSHLDIKLVNNLIIVIKGFFTNYVIPFTGRMETHLTNDYFMTEFNSSENKSNIVNSDELFQFNSLLKEGARIQEESEKDKNTEPKEQKNDLDDDAVLLLYELWYWSDETEKLAGETSRFIISPEFFKKQEESYDIKLGKLWAIYQNLEKLGYIKCGFENIPTGDRKNWYEITDKARLYFQDKEDNIVPGSLLIN